jgi:hypothetical protein
MITKVGCTAQEAETIAMMRHDLMVKMFRDHMVPITSFHDIETHDYRTKFHKPMLFYESPVGNSEDFWPFQSTASSFDEFDLST